MKRNKIILSLGIIILLASCSSPKKESDISISEEESVLLSENSKEEESVLLSDSNGSTSFNESSDSEDDNTFLSLIRKNEVMLYHKEGGFIIALNYQMMDEYVYTLTIVDYSLGNASTTFINGIPDKDNNGLTFNNVYLQTQNGIKSEFFPSSPASCSIWLDSSYHLKINDLDYQLEDKEVIRKYYLNPVFVNEWINKDKTFRLSVKKENKETIINLLEGDNIVTTKDYVYQENSVSFKINTSTSSLFKEGEEMLLSESDIGDISLTYHDVNYPLEVYVKEIGQEYQKGYFYFDNSPKGTSFTYQGLTLTLNAVIGQLKRWVNIKEGDINKEYLFDFELDGAALTYTCEIENKVGIMKYGVKYTLSAFKDNDDTIIKLIGNDDSEVVMTKE